MNVRGMWFAALAGLALAGLLIAHQGMADVLTTVAGIGWGLLPVLLVHVVQLILSGLAWRALFRGGPSPPVATLVWARWIRESVNSMMPMTLVGGDVIGIRLLALAGVRGALAGASVVVDLTIEAGTQCLFTLLGIGLILLQGQGGRAVQWPAVALMIMVPAVALFIVAQQRGMLRIVETGVGKFIARWSSLRAIAVDGLHSSARAMYRNPRALANACYFHLLSWLAGTVEVWLILNSFGAPVSLQEALVIESLGQGIRSAVFLVPGAFGVQEGGYMVLTSIYGLPLEVGLALSLVKRVRELVLGLPGLLIWTVTEGRGIVPATPPTPPHEGDAPQVSSVRPPGP